MTVETDILSRGRADKTEGSDGTSKKGNRKANSSRTIEQTMTLLRESLQRKPVVGLSGNLISI